VQNINKTKTKVKQNELFTTQLNHIFDDSKFIFICKEQESKPKTWNGMHIKPSATMELAWEHRKPSTINLCVQEFQITTSDFKTHNLGLILHMKYFKFNLHWN